VTVTVHVCGGKRVPIDVICGVQNVGRSELVGMIAELTKEEKRIAKAMSECVLSSIDESLYIDLNREVRGKKGKYKKNWER